MRPENPDNNSPAHPIQQLGQTDVPTGLPNTNQEILSGLFVLDQVTGQKWRSTSAIAEATEEAGVEIDQDNVEQVLQRACDNGELDQKPHGDPNDGGY